jgi:glucan 1,4-alpha-glucosidase
LNGEPGDFVTIAREERETGDWFIGSISDENPRTIQIKLDFLEPGITYDASIYADGPDADWDTNPTSIKIEHKQLDNTSELTLNLAPGGGCAVSLIRKK